MVDWCACDLMKPGGMGCPRLRAKLFGLPVKQPDGRGAIVHVREALEALCQGGLESAVERAGGVRAATVIEELELQLEATVPITVPHK